MGVRGGGMKNLCPGLLQPRHVKVAGGTVILLRFLQLQKRKKRRELRVVSFSIIKMALKR